MTKQKRKFFITDFADTPYNTQVLLKNMFKASREHRISNLPEGISPSFKYDVLYSYGEVMLLEIAMIIRGHTLKDVASLYNISYRRLLRIVNRFNRGKVTKSMNRVGQANGYVMQCILDYIDDTIPYIEAVIPENYLN